jgi:hypothetical protein
MRCNPWMDESGPDGYTVFLMLYFDSGVLLRSTSYIHAVVGNFEGELVQPMTTAAVR